MRNASVLWGVMGIAAVAAIITVAAVLSAGNARSPDIAALTFVVLCSAVAATAVVEVLKRLFSFRGAFQYRAVRRWLQPPEEAYESVERQWKQWARDQIESGSPELAADAMRMPQWLNGTREDLADYALHDLLGRLGVSESDDPARRRLFDSPIEQLAAQIAKAVDDAVTEPSGERWLAIRTGVSDASTQAGLLYSATFLRVLGSLASADEETKLTVLVHQVASREYAQQQVDLLQISVGADWRRLISWLSVVISGVVGTTLALLVQPGQAVTASVICILVGGFLSWVIRDVAAGIEKWRTSP